MPIRAANCEMCRRFEMSSCICRMPAFAASFQRRGAASSLALPRFTAQLLTLMQPFERQLRDRYRSSKSEWSYQMSVGGLGCVTTSRDGVRSQWIALRIAGAARVRTVRIFVWRPPATSAALCYSVFDCLSGLFGQRGLDGRFVFQSDDAVVSVAS